MDGAPFCKRCRTAAICCLQTRAETDRVIVEVEDEGGGVTADVALLVFDPFFTTKEKGVGLSLSIAYKITMQHDGSLQVSNGIRGAIFRVTLLADRKDTHARPTSTGTPCS